MAKKKVTNKRAKPGSGKQHDKHAPTIGSELAKAALEEVLQDEADAEAPDDENPND